MTELRWEVQDAEVDKMINGLLRILSPLGLKAFLDLEIEPYLMKRAKGRFRSEGDEASGPWAPLQAATVQIRESQQFPGEHPINKRTGELEAWVAGSGGTTTPHSLGATLRYPGTAPSGELKKKVEVAQKGLANPSTVPRPVLAIDEKDLLFTIAALYMSIEVAAK